MAAATRHSKRLEVLRARGRRVLSVFAVCLPVPVCAASGLSIPLPASVERIAVALVPWVETAAFDVGDALKRGARGAIVVAPGEAADSGPHPVLALGDAAASVPARRERGGAPELVGSVDPSRPGSDESAAGSPEPSGMPKISDDAENGPTRSEEPSRGSEPQPPSGGGETSPPPPTDDPPPPKHEDPPAPPKDEDPVTEVVDEAATTVNTAVDDTGDIVDDTVDTVGGILP